MPTPRETNRRCAFTLVEVFTVIVIVGVLLVITISVVGSMRQKARLTQCLSNHRQIATAYLLYLGDNKNMLWLQKNPQHRATQAENGAWGSMFGDQASPNSPGYLCRLLEPYGLKRAKWNGWAAIPDRMQTVWYCPLTASFDEVEGHGATYRYYYLGYHIGITDGPVSSQAVAEFWSKKPFLSDHWGNHQSPGTLPAPTNETARNVYAYLDGHVAYTQR